MEGKERRQQKALQIIVESCFVTGSELFVNGDRYQREKVKTGPAQRVPLKGWLKMRLTGSWRCCISSRSSN